MTGGLQIKSGRFYMVLNSAENGKRKQRWISTGLPVKGNERKAFRESLRENEVCFLLARRTADYLRLRQPPFWKAAQETRLAAYPLPRASPPKCQAQDKKFLKFFRNFLVVRNAPIGSVFSYPRTLYGAWCQGSNRLPRNLMYGC